ncbi:MAG: DUF6291 domain-containing protein [Bacteroidota bacterium]
MQDTQNKEVIQDKKRKSCIFYRSFFEAIEAVPEENQLSLYRAIFKYSLDFTEMDLDGLEAVAWLLIKPQLDANIRKYKNGCRGAEHGLKGGRPKTPKKPLANPTLTPNVNDNVNDNVLIGNQRFLKDLKENEASHASWAEALYMQLGLKPGKLAELLVGFSGHLQTLSKVHTTLEEFKQHFRNWLFTEDRNRRLEEYKRPKAGML